MDVMTGVFAILAVVVVVGGVAKVLSPSAFSATLATLGVPGGRVTARLSGVVEVVLGAAALLVGGRPAALAIAALYAVFAVVVVLARRRGAASCGCFGSVAAPPSELHVVVNTASAVLALLAAAVGVPGLREVLADQPAAGVPYLVTVATGAWLVVVLDTVGAELVEQIAAVRRVRPVLREQTHGVAVARTVPSSLQRPGAAPTATRPADQTAPRG